MGSIPEHPGSGTKSWSTSMPRCWRTRTLRASRSSRTGHTFPRKRPGVWPATRLGSSCDMTQTAMSRRLARGPAPFRRRFDGLAAPGPGLLLPRLRTSVRSGPSHSPLGPRRPHHAVLERQADGELRFRRPDGRPLPQVPPPAVVPSDPVNALRAAHDAQGLDLHARTAMPSWLGERLDVAYAIDV